MKKVLPIIILIVIVAVAWNMFADKETPDLKLAPPNATTQNEASGGDGVLSPKADPMAMDGEDLDDDIDDDMNDFDERPATEIYESSEEALAAIKKGAVDYDDLILEQFVGLGDGCTWCNDFYGKVKEVAFGEDVPEDQRSYYAEVLAVSGRLDNIKELVSAVKAAGESEEADVLAEALEMTVGGDDIVSYLSGELSTEDEYLRESVVAAITNQGSKYAIDTIYKHTLEVGDPDGYYSYGIGLGEVIPDDDALPLLQEMAAKQDDYSHLAVKALINQGMDGLRVVMDVMEGVNDPAVAKKMLSDAIDHVYYEDELEDYAKKLIGTSKNPSVVDFAKEILEEFKEDFDEKSAK